MRFIGDKRSRQRNISDRCAVHRIGNRAAPIETLPGVKVDILNRSRNAVEQARTVRRPDVPGEGMPVAVENAGESMVRAIPELFNRRLREGQIVREPVTAGKRRSIRINRPEVVFVFDQREAVVDLYRYVCLSHGRTALVKVDLFRGIHGDVGKGGTGNVIGDTRPVIRGGSIDRRTGIPAVQCEIDRAIFHRTVTHPNGESTRAVFRVEVRVFGQSLMGFV